MRYISSSTSTPISALYVPDGLLSIPTPCLPAVQFSPFGGEDGFVHSDTPRVLPPLVSEGTRTWQLESSLIRVVTIPLEFPGTLGSEPSIV